MLHRASVLALFNVLTLILVAASPLAANEESAASDQALAEVQDNAKADDARPADKADQRASDEQSEPPSATAALEKKDRGDQTRDKQQKRKRNEDTQKNLTEHLHADKQVAPDKPAKKRREKSKQAFDLEAAAFPVAGELPQDEATEASEISEADLPSLEQPTRAEEVSNDPQKAETLPEPEPKLDPKKYAITSLAEVDDDYWYQGEYVGHLRLPNGQRESAGLQVVARGEGKFIASQLRGGLPGNGWNRVQKIDLEGQRSDDLLILRNGQYQVLIDRQKGTVVNSRGDVLGVLTKIQRRSRLVGLQPGEGTTVLFDGSPTDRFVDASITEEGYLQIGTQTTEPVQDFRLHLEFRLPYMPYATGQARSNSGVYIQERYEVQILDSFGLPGAFNECGSLYRTKSPDINMCFPPLTWQSYDIYFRAARFDADGNKIAPARISVLHNGILVQDNYELPNKTGAGKAEGPEPRPIKLQDHGNPVVFRNIWIAPLPDAIESGRTSYASY